MKRYSRIMRIDLAQLKQHEENGEIQIAATNKYGRIKIHLNFNKLTGSADGHEFDLEKQACRYGGFRYWLKCPECGKRRRVLFLLDQSLICRDCSGVGYESQDYTKTDCAYYFHRAIRIATELDPSYDEETQFFPARYYFPERPKYMRHEKYWAKYKEFMSWIAKGNQVWLKTVGRYFSNL